MSNNDLKELEQLVSGLCDDGLSRDEVVRLEELLLDNPAAQAQYQKLIDAHLALCVASSALESEGGNDQQPNHSLLPLRPQSAAPAVTAQQPSSGWGWPMAAAAATILVCSAILYQSVRQLPPSAPTTAARPLGFSTIPKISHVSWEGPAFQPRDDDDLPLVAMSSGAIKLRFEKGRTADGYVICLNPGMSVDLVASFDATGENSLSIVELNGGPHPTAKKLTFHNAGDGPRPVHANPAAKNRRYGVLGHWTETNLSDIPRYYLLTGVHKLAQSAPGEEWRLSELDVFLESDDAVHIGWDDSGPAPIGDATYQPDGDFDDLAASLFFKSINGDRWADAKAQCIVTGDGDSKLQCPEDLQAGFAFDLPPGAIALVKGVSEASYPTGLLIVDADTSEVLWSRVKPRTSPAYLGIACISNFTPTSRALRLVAVHKSKAADAQWRTSASKTLYEQPQFNILGFDDSLGDQDYNDVRINLLIEGGNATGDRRDVGE